MTFKEAEAKFARARDKARGARLRGRLGATRLVQCGDAFGILVHNTIVVKIHRDGTYTLNSGGWHSKLTAERIAEYAPVSISAFKWVCPEGVHYWSARKDRLARYVDGMRVTSKGVLVKGSGNGTVTGEQARDEDRLVRNVRARARAKEKREIFAHLNPDKVCAVGKAIYGGARAER